MAAVDPASTIVINEVYGGGGNSNATYSHDFIELYNKGTAAVDLAGWSVQYAGQAGTNWSGQIDLTGSIAPGEYYVIQGASGNVTVGVALPVTPRASGNLNLAGANGNVALTNNTTRLSCQTAACAADPAVVDLVGFGTGAAFAGAAAPAPSNTTSISRDSESTNTGNNATDFTAGAMTPGAATAEPEPPVEPEAVTIPEIQGTGDASPIVGTPVIVRGVVTAAYPTGGLFGFVIQTPGTGGPMEVLPEGSDAVFIYQSKGDVVPTVGDHVEVTGTVGEFNGLTQVSIPDATGVVVLDDAAAEVTPISGIDWPATAAQREVLESMLFAPTGDYTVSNTYSTNQYGEVALAFGDQPLRQPTDFVLPRSSDEATHAAYDALVAENAARAVTLDDGASTNFLSAANSGLTPPYISLENPVRVGAGVTFDEPVIVDYRNGLWKFNPTYHLAADAQTLVTFENTRTDAPDAERLGDGAVQVAGFNVLNYFVTLGDSNASCVAYTDREGNGITVRQGCDQRGAWDAEDFERQQSKIVEAISAIDADVIGLMEIENSLRVTGEDDVAVANLVEALNTEAGGDVWAYVESSDELPPVAEMDVISNAIIYQPAAVQPVDQMRVLAEQSGPGEVFSNAREPIGQVFEPAVGGDPFLVVVNHFKSKGSGSGENADQNDGQGASNADRMRQATALAAWVDEVTAEHEGEGGVTELDTFLLGDFNSYSMEDPMRVLYDAGYVNANLWMEEEGFDREFSYSFSGLSGSLDHVLVNEGMLDEERVTGADIWEINAPEALALEYSRYNYHGTLFHEAGPYRSSDHDPVIVAFDPRGMPEPSVVTMTPVRVLTKDDVKPGTPQCVQITGDHGIPDGATGVIANVTTVKPTGLGHVVVYPQGGDDSGSTVNFEPGRDVANASFLALSDEGTLCYLARGATTGIRIDVTGYTTADSGIVMQAPGRVLDTRETAPVEPNKEHVVQIVGETDVPADAEAVLVNVTVVRPRALGNLLVYPGGERPEASTVNYAIGVDKANAAVVQLSDEGTISYWSETLVGTDRNPVHVVIDVLGWTTPGADYTALEPTRILDTREAEDITAREAFTLDVAGKTEVPDGATAVVLNVTAIKPTTLGHLRVYPAGTDAVPDTSSVNYIPGRDIANLVVVGLSEDGKVDLFSDQDGTVDVAVDVVGFLGATPQG